MLGNSWPALSEVKHWYLCRFPRICSKESSCSWANQVWWMSSSCALQHWSGNQSAAVLITNSQQVPHARNDVVDGQQQQDLRSELKSWTLNLWIRYKSEGTATWNFIIYLWCKPPRHCSRDAIFTIFISVGRKPVRWEVWTQMCDGKDLCVSCFLLRAMYGNVLFWRSIWVRLTCHPNLHIGNCGKLFKMTSSV